MFESMPLIANFLESMIDAFKRKSFYCLKCGHLDIEHRNPQLNYFGASSGTNRVCQYPSTSDPKQFGGQSCNCGSLELSDMKLARSHDATYIRRVLPTAYYDTQEWR